MEVIRIDNTEYYLSSDIINNSPIFSKGVRNGRELIKKKKIDESNFIFAKLCDQVWEKSNGKSIKLDKLFIKKSYVDGTKELLNELSGKEPIEDSKIKIAPDIIDLEDSEKFKDDKGNVLNIETRGERKCDGIYFLVKDVAESFGMNRLRDVILDKNKLYEEEKDYKYFLIENPTNSGKKQIKKILKKELFLTYEGLLRVLFVSRNNKTSRFIKWATESLFAIQMGTKKQKEELTASILGTDAETVSEVFNKSSHSTPCIYGFTLGTVKQLRKSMSIDTKYKDEDIVFKFGHTVSLARRTKEHIKTYGKINNCELKLACYSYIDPQFKTKAENDLKQHFKNLECFIEYDKQQELVVISNDELNNMKNIYSEIGHRHAGNMTDLIVINSKLESEIKYEKLNTHAVLMEKEVECGKLNSRIVSLEKELENVKLKNEIELLKCKLGGY